jgi:hypothetical protein
MLNGHKYSILYILHISTDYDYRLITIIITDAYTSEIGNSLKVHKIENFFGSEFEFYTFSLLVMLKY